MTPQTNEYGSGAIVTFCQQVVSSHANNWSPSEHELAEEFVAFSSLKPLVETVGLTKLCAGLGIQLSVSDIPKELRGYNCSFANQRAIVLRDHEDFPGGKEHTLLHELRELLECVFRDLGYPIAKDRELEARAEQFASQVRVAAWLKGIEVLFHGAGKLLVTWQRWGVYALVVLLGFFYVATCVSLPQLEDQLSKSRRAHVT